MGTFRISFYTCFNKYFDSYLYVYKSFFLTVFIGLYIIEWCTEFMRKRHQVSEYSPGKCELFESRFAFVYYQLISEPPIQNSVKGKSLGGMSVLCNRKKLAFMMVQRGLWFLNSWPEGRGKMVALYFAEIRKDSQKVDSRLLLRGVLLDITLIFSCL